MIICSNVAWAQQRSVADVADIAVTHLSGGIWQQHMVRTTPKQKAPAKSRIVGSSQILKTATGISPDSEAFYVYVDGNSFVIVSGDERMTPVLAYSDTNGFDTDNIPCNVKSYLDNYVQSYKQLGAVEQTTTKLQMRSGQRHAITGNVEPFVLTQWNQDAPFNNLCPNIPGHGKAVTGCVATAMAQSMSVFAYPDCGTGSINYVTDSYGISIQDDLSNYPFDWSNMLTNYNHGYNQTQGNAVANLMYACGLSINMDYGPQSGASAINAMKSAIEHFGYDADMFYASMDGMALDEWHFVVTENLKAGNPVIYSGRNERNEGHAFVIDGYTATSADPYYHVNWGWGGMYDGDYQMLHLSPAETGIGGGMGNFNLENFAVIGFKPDDSVVENGGFMQATEASVLPATIAAGGRGSVELKTFFNFGARSFSGALIAYAVDSEGNRTELGRTNVNNLRTSQGWYNFSLDFTLPSSVADGTYTIEVCMAPQGLPEQPVYCGGDKPLLYVGGEPEPYDPEIMVTDLSAQFTGGRNVEMTAVRLLNYGPQTFNGKVKIAIADTDDNIITDFGYPLEVDGLGHFYSFPTARTLTGMVPEDIPDGDYHLWLVAQQSGYTNWEKVTKFTLEGNTITASHLPCFVEVTLADGIISVNEDDMPEFYPNLQTTAFTVKEFVESTGYISTIAENVCNLDDTAFTGQISLCITDLDGQIVETFGTPYIVSTTLAHYNLFVDPLTISGNLPTDIANGAYLLQLAAKQNGCRGWGVMKKWVFENGYIIEQNLDNGIPVWFADGKMFFTEPSADGVQSVSAASDGGDAMMIYSPAGQRISKPRSGINIIRTTSGTVRKQVMHLK